MKMPRLVTMQVVATKEEWDELMSKPDVTYIVDFTATCESEFMILNRKRDPETNTHMPFNPSIRRVWTMQDDWTSL